MAHHRRLSQRENSRTVYDGDLREGGRARALSKGLAAESPPGSNMSDNGTRLMPGVSEEGPGRVGNVLLDDEFPEKKEWHMICLSDIHPLPTDRGISENVKGERLRPQTDTPGVRVLDVHDHSREAEDFVAKRSRAVTKLKHLIHN